MEETVKINQGMIIFCRDKLPEQKSKFVPKDLNPPDLWSHETTELTHNDKEFSEEALDEIKDQISGEFTHCLNLKNCVWIWTYDLDPHQGESVFV